MQSGYGGVSEIQQFMVESCGGPSLFSITTANPPSGTAAAAAPPTDLKFHPLPLVPHPHPHHHQHLHHHQPQPPLPPQHPTSMMPHFTHFHSMPVTQQLFQQSHLQFHQLFHPHHQHPPPSLPAPQLELRRMIPPHHHLGLDQDSDPETGASPTQMITGSLVGGSGGAGSGVPSFLAAAMNFKLAMNESSGGGSREAINDDDGGILQGEDGSESHHHPWQREDESAIKEPSWRPLDIDFINRNNKRCKDKEPAEVCTSKYSKKSKEIGEYDDDHNGGAGAGGGNYKPFSELEAIYKPGGGGTGSGPNQAGSGSALTAVETTLVHVAATAAAPGLPAAINPIGGSETSAGEEAPVKKFSKNSSRSRRKKRRQQQQLSSAASFFENLVKRLMDHQENLHRKFLEVMEKRDQERTGREEAWRKQEAAKSSREAAARAQERALATSREAVIIAFLEKITGESLNLPTKPQFPFPDTDPSKEDDNNTATDTIDDDNNHLRIFAATDELNTGYGDGINIGNSNVAFNSSRWPKAEVQALIRVRSGLEPRFQEPGLKGPLWEEVSSTMAALGYQRSAKRCKEKWENINKYFRKTKESGKKRPQHSKTCPYFQQLDQLYSKPFNKKLPSSSSSSPPAINVSESDQRKDNSELLDAVIESTDHGSLKFSGTLAARFDDLNEATGAGIAGKIILLDHHGNVQLQNKELFGGEEDEDINGGTGEEEEEEEEDEEGEGEGESQDHEVSNGHQQYQLQQNKEEDDLHDSNDLYFQRLQS